jgi:hypothetical protein
MVTLLHCLSGCGRTWLELLPEDVDGDGPSVQLDASIDDISTADVDVTEHPDPVLDVDASRSAPDGGADHLGDAAALDAGGAVANSDAGEVEPATCARDAPVAAADLLIDDLEDGDALIREAEGRRGAWYTVNDGSRSATQTPAPGAAFVAVDEGARGSAYAARTWGRGFLGWGAALGVRLNAAAQTACAYDASATDGIRFYARGSGTATVSVSSAATLPVAAGGTCSAGCLDYYATRIVLTSHWSLHEISWRELRQTGWGTPVRFDPARLFAVEFAFGRGVAFDLYVDDLTFY